MDDSKLIKNIGNKGSIQKQKCGIFPLGVGGFGQHPQFYKCGKKGVFVFFAKFLPIFDTFDCKISGNFSHRGSGRCGKNPHFSFLKASLISFEYERNNSATASFFDVDCSFCTYSRPYALLICVSDLNCIHWSYNSL